jgi:hypothetical protein
VFILWQGFGNRFSLIKEVIDRDFLNAQTLSISYLSF